MHAYRICIYIYAVDHKYIDTHISMHACIYPYMFYHVYVLNEYARSHELCMYTCTSMFPFVDNHRLHGIHHKSSVKTRFVGWRPFRSLLCFSPSLWVVTITAVWSRLQVYVEGCYPPVIFLAPFQAARASLDFSGLATLEFEAWWMEIPNQHGGL